MNVSNHPLSDGAAPMLRQFSVRAVIDVLLERGATSRADLAKLTGLSKQTMSGVIRELEEQGWVRAEGLATGRVGRTAITYAVDERSGFVLGVDLGATTLRLAVAGITGRSMGEIEGPADPKGGLASIGKLETLRRRLLDEAGVPADRVLGIAVATPGVVDPRTGRLSLAPNLPSLGGVDLRQKLRHALGGEPHIENDVNCAAVGESWLGNGKGAESLAFVSLGTGIGLGMLIDGRLLRGARGAAGEISYLPFGSDPLAAESLDKGALERALGAAGIVERYAAAGGSKETSVRDILGRARASDRAAETTVAETARTAALLIVAVEAMFDPARIVLGGNIGGNPDVLRRVREALTACSRVPIGLEPSLLGRRATLTGTIAIALNRLHTSLFSPNDLPGLMRLPRPAR